MQEELGYSLEDWKEVVNVLVKAGLPEEFGEGLKLAAKARRGSNKALRSMNIENGVRSIFHMKFQVTRNSDGEVDALIALYRLQACDTEKRQTNIETEQLFKRLVELDAEKVWRSEVQQFLESNQASQEES